VSDGAVREELHRLYRALQAEKRLWRRARRARWYVQRDLSGEWDGPFEAVEVAFQVYAGALDACDEVIDGRSRKRFLVGRTRFLARWARPNPEVEARLWRGLRRALGERRRAAQRATPPERGAALVAPGDLWRAYRLLDLDPLCGADEVKRRHHALALAHHPDRGGSLQRMKEINWAYGVISRARGASGPPPG
jgi:hypothetical protein